MRQVRDSLLQKLKLKEEFSTALYTILFNSLNKNSFGLSPDTNKVITDDEMTAILESITIKSLSVFLPYRTEVTKQNAAKTLEENFYHTMTSSALGQHMMFYDTKRRFGDLLSELNSALLDKDTQLFDYLSVIKARLQGGQSCKKFSVKSARLSLEQ